MKFGRVEGFLQKTEDDRLRLVVTLETNSGITTIREEVMESQVDDADLFWLADQYTQETIGHHLALEGWEVVGAGDSPESDLDGPARSSLYTVRNLG